MGLATGFTIAGMLSHWQVWIAVAVVLHVSASILNRYGRAGEFQVPRFLNLRILPFRSRSRPASGSGAAGGRG
jgi:hypothetical protein